MPKPKADLAPEVYEAIIRECGHRATRLGEHLQAHGWTLADAAWVVVNWDLTTLAAALANERAKHKHQPTGLSAGEAAELESANAASAPQPRKTTARVVRITPRIPSQAPGEPEG